MRLWPVLGYTTLLIVLFVFAMYNPLLGVFGAIACLAGLIQAVLRGPKGPKR